ncbi:MAG: patatin-like phospholipase family protein [Alphaproteobacteria bacterium]|nr:patatin-like phospholipase family protein [Alphaproteobacteria bacterium]
MAPDRHGVGPAKRVNLALQGGGSHGAFTWGVLDRLLEDHRIEFDSISGTSAGAMNAAVLASGYSKDGRDGARQALEQFWMGIADMGQFGPIRRSPLAWLTRSWRLDDSPSFFVADALSRLFSPYELNPSNLNPLKPILERVVDFDAVRHASGIKLFVCATNVRTGKVKVFNTDKVTLDVLLASACLPFMYQAVQIEGEYYYDGGYMGNPSIFPLHGSDARDLIIVQINPLHRPEIPRTAREIIDRVNEISFNGSLMNEMRAVHFINELIVGNQLDPLKYRQTRVHMIECDERLNDLHASSKLNAERDFLLFLKDIGREAADFWLRQNANKVGVESSIDVAKTFL